MPSHNWVVVRLANSHYDRGDNVKACHPNYYPPDKINGRIPDVYVKTIGRIYEVKNTIAELKKKNSIEQFKAFKSYPKARGFYIVLCQNINPTQRKECYRILRSRHVKGYHVLSWKEAINKIKK